MATETQAKQGYTEGHTVGNAPLRRRAWLADQRLPSAVSGSAWVVTVLVPRLHAHRATSPYCPPLLPVSSACLLCLSPLFSHCSNADGAGRVAALPCCHRQRTACLPVAPGDVQVSTW